MLAPIHCIDYSWTGENPVTDLVLQLQVVFLLSSYFFLFLPLFSLYVAKPCFLLNYLACDFKCPLRRLSLKLIPSSLGFIMLFPLFLNFSVVYGRH